MTTAQVPIAIIGAGPAGLTLARLLELANIAYMVFEKSTSADLTDEESRSGTLDIHRDSGQEALRAAGLFDSFQSVARYNVPVRIADDEDHVLADIPGEENNDKPEIDRKDLQKILLASVPAARIRWGCAVVRTETDQDGTMSLYDKDGQVVADGFSLVVGADGAWSKVRAQVASELPQLCNIRVFTSIIKPQDPTYELAESLAEKGNYLALGNERQIFLHYLGDDTYHLSAAITTTQLAESRRTVHEPSELWNLWLEKEFSTWNPRLRELLEHSQQSFQSWPLYSMTEDSVTWQSIKGVTLIGDAAHLTVPSGGGVNNAMHDAHDLSKRIIKYGLRDLHRAALEYEEELRPRALGIVKKGNWFAEHFFRGRGAAAFLEAASSG
ncbi:putative monooxygenase [Sarocladium strictum]